MTKYDGVKIVSTEAVESKQIEIKNEGAKEGGFFVRLICAVLCAAALFGAKNIQHPYAKITVDTIKTAMSYDVIKNPEKQRGTVKFIELIKSVFGESEE